MRDRFHLNNAAIFAVMWVALSGLVLRDISLRHNGGGSAAAVSDRVVTKELTLIDDNGVTRARIGMSDKTNAPSVQLFDAAGAQRAQLRLNKDDVPSLRLYNAEGKIKSVVGFVSNDSQPTFATFDMNGVGHVENRTRSDAAYLNVQDEDLTGGRYVQSYHGMVDLYAGQTIPSQTSGLHFYYTQQAQANEASARYQVQVNADSARLQVLQAQQQLQNQVQLQRVELARQRAVNEAIKAAADTVNIEVDPIRTEK